MLLRRHSRPDSGFSFIEMLAYMVIAAMLLLAAIPQFDNYRDKARLSVLRDDTHNAAIAAEAATIGVIAAHSGGHGVHLAAKSIHLVDSSAIIQAVTAAVTAMKVSDKATTMQVIDTGGGDYDILGTNTAIRYQVAYASAADPSRGYSVGLNIIRPDGTTTPTTPTPSATATATPATPSATPTPTATQKTWAAIDASALITGQAGQLNVSLNNQSPNTWGATTITVTAGGKSADVKTFPYTVDASNVAAGKSEPVVLTVTASDGQVITQTITATRSSMPSIASWSISGTVMTVTLTALPQDWGGSKTTLWGMAAGTTSAAATTATSGASGAFTGTTLTGRVGLNSNCKYMQLFLQQGATTYAVDVPFATGYKG